MTRLATLLTAILLSTPAWTQEVEVGDIGRLPYMPREMVVVNPKPVPYGYGDPLRFGQRCVPDPQSGLLTVIGIEGASVLIEFTKPPVAFYEIGCPSGVFFLITKDEFALMTKNYRTYGPPEQMKQWEMIERMLKRAGRN